MSLLGSRAQGPERSAVSCYFSRLDVMATDELEVVRALLTSKPRPEGWSERRERLDELGSVWSVAGDITLEPVDIERFSRLLHSL